MRVSAPEGLTERVMQRIAREQHRALLMRRAAYGFCALASGAAAGVAGVSLAHSLAASGFYQYLSLALSESGVIVAYWREFALALGESVPAGAAAGLFAAAGCFIWSAPRAIARVHRTFVWA